MPKTHLTEPGQEEQFLADYDSIARLLGINPNPDNPLHFYDYRRAWDAGEMTPSGGHLPSRHKLPGHPNRFVEGVDTITDQPASPIDRLSNLIAALRARMRQ